MKEFSYFPGCSLHGTSREFDESIKGVMDLLNIRLHELEDWTCCGSTSAHCLDENLATEMSARNLAIAEKSDRDLLVPCASCYSRFKAAELEVKEHGKKVSFPYQAKVPIRFAMDYLCDKPVMEEVKKKMVKPLAGLKAVCYYGCLPVRPPKLTGIKDYENPMHMDRLLKQLGYRADSVVLQNRLLRRQPDGYAHGSFQAVDRQDPGPRRRKPARTASLWAARCAR